MKENIVKNIRKGDRKAFRELFDHFFNALASFGYKYTGSIETAEDMVQEVFVSLWEKRKDFDHILAVKSFLYTSVRNRCLNHLKHESVKKKHEASLIYELETDASFSSQVIQEEVFNNLYSEIRELPKASMEIMLLALNGMKNQEIADELNISINTVKTQKKIAYAKLKESLGPGMGIIVLIFFLPEIEKFFSSAFTRF